MEKEQAQMVQTDARNAGFKASIIKTKGQWIVIVGLNRVVSISEVKFVLDPIYEDCIEYGRFGKGVKIS